MQFFENEEDQRPPPAEIIFPIPSHPFPFLKLPREIRDAIYHFALIRSGTGPNVKPTGICFMHHKASSPHVSTSYWGTEKSTRIFRVNHQICSEATEVFYSTFPFHFSQTIDLRMVHDTLRDTLPLRARNFINNIGFMILVRTRPNPFTAEDDEKQRRALEAVVALLPNIKRVEVSLAVFDRDVPDWQVKDVVTRALEKLGPLRDLPGLSIRGGFNENSQRARIVRKVREALGCL